MTAPFLLSRVLLRFADDDDDLIGNLSAAMLTPDGSLWVASDEYLTLERLVPTGSHLYGDQRAYPLGEYVELSHPDHEIDIESLDYDGYYLWLTGSHSTKRKRPKGKLTDRDITRLATITRDYNRYLIARFPLVNGELFKACTHPDDPDRHLTAASLQKSPDSNQLLDALITDPHVGPFLTMENPLPSKDNGLDIEGMVVRGHRIFLGLRGPVLRGWAMILEIEVGATGADGLTLQTIGPEDRCYRKHFVHLDGLGIRDMCGDGDDLLIMAGPTMELAGTMRLFRFKSLLDLDDDSIHDQTTGRLTPLFDLPYTPHQDYAEGLTLYPCLGQAGVLVIYDNPIPARRPTAHSIFGDVFQL
ncbi:MAG: DUF3616 domain-containing protein [Proteobacteria bacterium]|nr:DUF3616 domain-containing protein [Pseudomonadota bacterium]